MHRNSSLPDALPPSEFIHQVRAALAHLYDFAYLQNHALSHSVIGGNELDDVTRSQKMRRVLLESIDALQPQGQSSADDARAYAILTYRCIDGLAMDEIATKLNLSRRQAYREYAKGCDAIADLLWDRMQQREQEAVARHPAAGAAASRLAVARVEVERLRGTVTTELLTLQTVVAEVSELLAPRVERLSTRIRLSTLPGSPAVAADRAMLRQALLTVLSYALDSVSPGGELSVWTLVEGDRLALMIEGSIDPAAQPTPTQPRREGVGLSVAEQLLKVMGGALSIEPSVDRWTARVELPCVRAATVLVIDDNAEIMALFQRYLAGHKVTVVGANNGQQAVEMARDRHPNLIILDLMLPHVDGWEILQKLKTGAETQAIPVVICSVLNEPDLALAMGASDYITKPVSQDDLVALLRRWLGTLHPAA